MIVKARKTLSIVVVYRLISEHSTLKIIGCSMVGNFVNERMLSLLKRILRP